MGKTGSLPSKYSDGVRQLINSMLEIDPNKRPSGTKYLCQTRKSFF